MMALRHYGIHNAFSTLVLSLVSEASATELSLAKEKKAEPGPWSEFSSPHTGMHLPLISSVIFVAKKLICPKQHFRTAELSFF